MCERGLSVLARCTDQLRRSVLPAYLFQHKSQVVHGVKGVGMLRAQRGLSGTLVSDGLSELVSEAAAAM